MLHHFIPTMLLPLVVFWRSKLISIPRFRRALLFGTGLAGALALLLSLPINASPHTSARVVGSAVEDRSAGYERADPAAFKRSEILSHLFPYAWDPAVPGEAYGGSPLMWNFYAHPRGDTPRQVNYVIQSSEDPAPTGWQLLAVEGEAALYLRSEAVWKRHLALRPPSPGGSPLYDIPRGIIFRSVPLDEGPRIINLVDVLEGVGVDLEPVLVRLGVSR